MAEEVSESKSYKKVIDHRHKCRKWGKEFCLDCFGGGLNMFVESLIDEEVLKI